MSVNDIKQEVCCGCGACYNACPTNAISIGDAKITGRYPIVSEECINCGKCIEVCPTISNLIRNKKEDRECFAARSSHFSKDSQSGGLFPVIAQYILNNGGYVVGVENVNNETKFSIAKTFEEIQSFRKSKYCQPNTEKIYSETEQLLKDNKLVLFCGLPCHIKALYLFLGREYENLYTINLWCHGVPSKLYYDELSASEIEFKKKYNSNEIINEACLNCSYTILSSQYGDFTIGDLWASKRGDDERLKSFMEDKCPSFIIFNNDKSKAIKEYIKNECQLFEKIDYNDIVKYNRRGPITRIFKDNKIALYGHTENDNFGSLLTYYSLYKVICDLGGDVTVIPRSSSVKAEKMKTYQKINACNPNSKSAIFFKEHCKMAKRQNFEGFKYYNSLFTTFICGSDMIWKHRQYLWSKDTFFLNFVNNNHKKIAISSSFGSDDIDGIFLDSNDESEINSISNNLNTFNAISVREFSGLDILDFLNVNKQIPQQQLPDPVFFNDRSFYEDIANEYDEIIDKCDTVGYFVTETNKSVIKEMETNGDLVFYDGHITDDTVQKFLKYMLAAKQIKTDSFHGVCLSIILNKPFTYYARGRCETRIETLNKLFSIDIQSGVFNDFEWDKINLKLQEIKKQGEEYLKRYVL